MPSQAPTFNRLTQVTIMTFNIFHSIAASAISATTSHDHHPRNAPRETERQVSSYPSDYLRRSAQFYAALNASIQKV